jgi:sugar-specific transcriptional regulator TrmB
MTLHDLGFSELQEATYRALITDPGQDAAVLAARLGAAEDAVRTALARLADMGTIRPDPEATAGFSVCDPSVAVGELIERMEDQTLRRHRQIGSTRAELAGLAALHHGATAAAAPGLETVEGLENVRERLAELSFFSRSSIWSVEPPWPHSAAAQAAASQLDERSLRRGTDLRIIYNNEVLDSERNRLRLRERMAAGAQIRLRTGPLRRLIIMDERVAVVPADPASGRPDAVIVQQADLLQCLLDLFRGYWDTAREPRFTEGSEPDLAADDRAVLGLLASGATDEIAARQVGVSVRHLRRKVARLMSRLQAGSRFQAGAAAAHRGWI